MLISSEHRLIKPQREAFEKILQMLTATPENTLFIDNRETHVTAARNLGLNAIQFTDWISFHKALIKRNIII